MHNQQLTDEEIAVRLKENFDATLFTILVHRYEKSIIRQCKEYLKDEETAKDVSQEVFIRLLTKIGSFRQEAAFATWLRTIIHNRCTDHLRKDKKALHKEISGEIAATLEAELDTDDIEKPTTEILEELLEKIKGEEKLLLMLKYREGWTVKEIQHALQISESAVKMRLERTKAKIDHFLEKYRVA
jgi:RNA polymerase sigma factor (sigma-70 family)